ncbi:DUF2971 domain-containing protein [Leucobacter insecticola]|uniref:DUF2971 domain-containing protein n=2 Tax=Leucobacter insecticola TaxID=2714934 RepID=A0A6G8FGR8_9MICO|nr:DUF2971 domain-containing protein [Leucobacter insecticola]
MSQRVIESARRNLREKDGAALASILGQPSYGPLSTAVACFCASDDLLGQWRAYSQGKGFAIGFDSKALAKRWITETREGVFAPVRYSLETAMETADRHGKEIADAWKAALPGGIEAVAADSFRGGEILESDVESLARQLCGLDSLIGPLLMSAAFHKDPHFTDEREWRLVTRLASPISKKDDGGGARSRDGGLAIYRAVKFQESPDDGPIRRVRVGPGLPFEEQGRALEWTLSAFGYNGVDVLESAVPLRFV